MLWLGASAVVLLGLVPCLVASARGSPLERLVALELASTVSVLGLLLLAAGSGRAFYFDVALTLTIVSFAGSLLFTRFLERWL